MPDCETEACLLSGSISNFRPTVFGSGLSEKCKIAILKMLAAVLRHTISNRIPSPGPGRTAVNRSGLQSHSAETSQLMMKHYVAMNETDVADA
jgi:hypothetical protein